jgi:hypothetical protein
MVLNFKDPLLGGVGVGNFKIKEKSKKIKVNPVIPPLKAYPDRIEDPDRSVRSVRGDRGM